MRSLFRHLGLLMAVVFLVAPAAAQDTIATDEAGALIRNYHAPDMAFFDYPLETHSIRLNPYPPTGEFAQWMTFPGMVSVEPNDLTIYTEGHGVVYRVLMLSVANNDGLGEGDLVDLVGRMPYVQFESDLLAGQEMESFEIDGLPAIAFHDLPIGPAGVIDTYILAIYDRQIFQIVVEPVADTGGDSDAGRQMVDTLLASLRWDIDR